MSVYLTPLQKQILDLYIEEGLTQEQIAIKLYNDKYKQGNISKRLKEISNKMGVKVTRIYGKGRSKQKLYNFKISN